MVINHDAKRARGLQHPPCFMYALLRVGAVMHDSVRVDHVESGIGEGQLLGIGETQIRFVAGYFAAPHRLFERSAGKIDAGGVGTGLQPLQIVSAHSYSDFKHSLTGGLREPGELRYIGFEPIARAGMRLEVNFLAQIARPAGIGVPEFLDLVLQFGDWRGFRHGSKADTSTAILLTIFVRFFAAIFMKTAADAKMVRPSTGTDVIETKSENEMLRLASSADVLPLSVIIPVRNEARNLPRCLEALRAVGEVYVIDSNSSDETAAIARSQGAKVVQFHYAGGWPKKRQWAMDTLPLAYEWILLLDADEVLTAELAEEIRRAIQDPDVNGYYIALQMYFLGRQLRHSGASFWKLSLFRKGCGAYECRLHDQDTSMADMEVHEHVIVRGATRKLRNPLVHHNVESLSRYFQKHNEYSNWEARVWLESGRKEQGDEIRPAFWGTQAQRRRWLRRHFLELPGSSVLFFFYKYVLKFGFLDGVPGLIYCVNQGIQFFQIKAKIYELRLGRN